MLLALDPSIILAAPYDLNMDSLNLLSFLGITQNAPKLKVQLAVDEFDIVKRSYQTCLKCEGEGGWKTLSHQFADYVLGKWEHWTENLRTDSLPPEILQFIDENGCVDELERCLIALAVCDGVLLSCVSSSVDYPGKKVRVILHDASLVEQLRRVVHSFSLDFPAEARAKLEERFLSSLFEQKVADWISRNMRYPRETMETSYYGPYLREAQGAGEIDVLGFDYVSNPRRVLVCECKLRMPGNEEKLVSQDEIEQLVTTWEVVRDEKQREYARAGYSVRVFALLVSNSLGITSEARDLAKSKKVVVQRAYLPDDWHRYTDWFIDRCERLRN